MDPLFDILARQIRFANRLNWLIISLILAMSFFWFVMFFWPGLCFNHTYQAIMTVPLFASIFASVAGIMRFFIMPKTRLVILCFALGVFCICLDLFGCLWMVGTTINAFM